MERARPDARALPALDRRRSLAGVLAATLSATTGCSSLLIYSPSAKYDNQIVRGEVTYIASQDDLRANWNKMASTVDDPPPLEEFVRHYRRVTVTITKGLGSGEFVYPFVPDGMDVGLGDIVDTPVYVGGSLVRKFAGRPQLLNIVCHNEDFVCKKSREGQKRGAIGPVDPR